MTNALTLTVEQWDRHVVPLVAQVRRDLVRDYEAVRDAGLPDAVYAAVGITIELASDYLRAIDEATNGANDEAVTIEHAGVEILRSHHCRLVQGPLQTRDDLVRFAAPRWIVTPEMPDEAVAEILVRENARRASYTALTAPIVTAVREGLRAAGRDLPARGGPAYE